MGGLDRTTDFYRLYVVPGMRHCSADSEGGDNIDYPDALEQWVERGKAPEGLIGYQVQRPGSIYSTPILSIPRDWIRRTRVAFPYSDEAHDKGRGDPDDPADTVTRRGPASAVNRAARRVPHAGKTTASGSFPGRQRRPQAFVFQNGSRPSR